MIEIFIPVLWICINARCEFMQSDGFYFTKKEVCMASLEQQKTFMIDLVKQANQGSITMLEGVCVDVKLKTVDERQETRY